MSLPTYDASPDSVTLVYVPATAKCEATFSAYAKGYTRFEFITVDSTNTLSSTVVHSVALETGGSGKFSESNQSILQIDKNGDGQVDTTVVTHSSTFVTSVDQGSTHMNAIPTTIELEQNYPNPFNPSTTIRYGLPHKSAVQLSVFNTLGQQVAVLQNGEQEAGYHEVEFDGRNLSSGVYFYRIEVRPLDSAIGRDSKSGAGSSVQTRKLLLIR